MHSTTYTILGERLAVYREAQKRLIEEFLEIAQRLIGSHYAVRLSHGLQSIVIRYDTEVLGYITFTQIGDNPHMALERTRDVVDIHRQNIKEAKNGGNH